MKAARPGKKLIATCAIMAAALAVITPPAHAGTSVSFGPVRITDVPAAGRKTHEVDLQAQINVAMREGQTAYVYSTLRAYDSAHVNMIDSEVRCSGAGKGDVVLGENIDPAANANPDRGDITIVNRFLVSASSSGTLTCAIYTRTTSLADATSSVTVSGTLRFAATQVAEDAHGLAMQTSLPSGNTIVDDTVTTPVLDRTISPGHTKVAVIADVQYMSCWPTACVHSSETSNARFTLVARQMKGTATCASAPPAQTSVAVSRQTHHKVVPLYTSVTLVPGCDRIHAYVQAEHVSGKTGAIQGQANGLTDATPPGTHNSVMTHMFAVPS